MTVTSLSPEKKRLLVNNQHLMEKQTMIRELKKEEMNEEMKEEMTTEEMSALLVKTTDVMKEGMIVVMTTEGKTAKIEEEIITHASEEKENSTVMMIEKEKTEDPLKEKMIVDDELPLVKDSITEENQENKNQENQFLSHLNLLTLLLLEICLSLLLLMTCNSSSLLKTARWATSESLLVRKESPRAMDTWNLMT